MNYKNKYLKSANYKISETNLKKENFVKLN